jgi:hypothetical protein
MAFAGEVFPEWYWGPIFFAVVFWPVLAAVAFVADLTISRVVRRLTWSERGMLWGVVFVVGTLGILGGRALIDHARFEREAKAAVRHLDFTPYAASPLPATFREESVEAQERFGTPAIVSRYRATAGTYAFAYQQAPAEVSLQAGHCSLRHLAGTSSNFYDGPCRELRTPRGRAVFIGAGLENTTEGGQAFALLEGTLVRFEHVQVADRDVLAYFDSLRPVAPDDVDFKKG